MRQAPLTMRAVLLCGASLMGAGCVEVNCATLADVEQRDWCTYEQVGRYAEHDQLLEASEAVMRISSPVVSAAAVDRLLEGAGDGMTIHEVRALCSSLSGDASGACTRMWERGHLWGP